MKKVDFCFLTTETFIDAKHKVLTAKELERLGYSSFFITTSKAGDITFKKANLTNFQNIEEISKNIQIKDNDLETKIAEIEEAFMIDNVRTDVLTEKTVFKEKHEKPLIKKFLGYILALNDFFDEKIEVKYFVQGLSGSVNSFAFYYVARKKSKHIYFSIAPFPGLINFSFHPWGILKINDQDIELGLNPKDKEFISGYVDKLKQEKNLNLIIPLVRSNPHITKARIKTLFKLLRNAKNEHLPTLFIFKNFWKRYFRRLCVRRFYSKSKPGERYAFFPLHFPDDSQLTARAIPFMSQEFLVEIISRYLPLGLKLYVKEHPGALGYFPVRMLSYIKDLPNVKIVRPFSNTHNLIKGAEMVFTINSTVGSEALMYQKPVITFGKSFYRNKDVTLDVNNLYDLPEVINKAKNFKPDWNRILTLFHLWHKHSFPPRPVEVLYTIGDPKQENIKTFCGSLLKFLKLQNKVRE